MLGDAGRKLGVTCCYSGTRCFIMRNFGEARSSMIHRDGESSQLHPLVSPQLSHFKHTPLRTSVNEPQALQGSPS